MARKAFYWLLLGVGLKLGSSAVSFISGRISGKVNTASSDRSRTSLTTAKQEICGRSILPSKPLTGKNDWKPGINATKALFGNEPTSRIPNRTNDAGGTPMAG